MGTNSLVHFRDLGDGELYPQSREVVVLVVSDDVDCDVVAPDGFVYDGHPLVRSQLFGEVAINRDDYAFLGSKGIRHFCLLGQLGGCPETSSGCRFSCQSTTHTSYHFERSKYSEFSRSYHPLIIH